MTTVVSRMVRSSPFRDAAKTWEQILDLLTQGKNNSARTELLSVSGIACSLIADQAPRTAPIVVTCDGPRTRVYCTYDEDSLDGTDASEDALSFDPLKGNWAISLPCHKDDLNWVQAALKKHSSKISARDVDSGITTEQASATSQSLTLDVEGFLKL